MFVLIRTITIRFAYDGGMTNTHNTFTATAPDGYIWTRKTKGQFSHAVLGLDPTDGWHIVGFRSTLADAQKEATKWVAGMGTWGWNEVIIVETVEVK